MAQNIFKQNQIHCISLNMFPENNYNNTKDSISLLEN